MLLEIIKNRRSIRKYQNKEINELLLLKLLESARLAPSGSNTQPWHFIIIRDYNKKKEIVENSNNQNWMLTAPVFIVCVADISSTPNDSINEISEESPDEEIKQIIRDTSIAIEHIVLQATHEGLGTCWVSWFQQKNIRPLLNIPNDKYVVCVLTLGFPAEKPKERPRKNIEQIIHYNNW